MKIALIATNYAEYAANLALELSRTHQVLLVLSARSAQRELLPESLDELRRCVLLKIVPHHYAPLQAVIARLAAQFVLAFRPDVVHVQEHPTNAMHLLAKRLAGGFPLVVTVHDPVPHSGEDTSAADSFADSYAGLRDASDRLIVHGDSLTASLAGQLRDGARRVRAAPFGLLRFGSFAGDMPAAPATKERSLIFFGRMNRYKGLELLLDANEHLSQMVTPPPKLIVAGAGAEIARLRERLRAAPNITLVAKRLSQTALGQMVRRSLAAILPYRDATQSGAAASALGVGTPVIATCVGALHEMIESGHNGLIVPPDDAAALAGAAERLLNNAELQTRLTLGARQTASRNGWDAVRRVTEVVYAQAIEEHAANRNLHLKASA